MRKTECATDGGAQFTSEPTYGRVTSEPTVRRVTAEPTQPATSGGDYTRLGNGYCLNENGGGTRGMGHFRKSDAECRATCEDFGMLCTGYASMNSGSGTCYVYGRIEYNDRPDGWVGAGSSWGPIDPVRGSENFFTMTCFRKN